MRSPASRSSSRRTSSRSSWSSFDGAGESVADVNKKLLEHEIFGGKDLSAEFPELGQSALYCVTEYHDQADIEKLASAVKEVTA